MRSKIKHIKSCFLWLRKHKKTTRILSWFRRTKGKRNEYKYFWPIVFLSLIIVFGFWFINYHFLVGDTVNRGTFGDMFGAVNAVFSGLAFAGIIISLYLQRIDLKTQKEQLELNYEEVRKTNEEFELQNKTLSIQLFENQYYKMIELHKDNVQEMKITFFDHIKVPYQSPQGHGHSNQEIIRDVTGRKIFVGMMREFHALYEIVEHVAKEIKLTLPENKICSLAYQIFFHGKNSNSIEYGDSPVNFKKRIPEALKHYQVQFYNRHERNKDESKSDGNYFFKFYPFEGHESRLAHYYRHLFQTVKFVVQQEEKGLIEYHQTRQYLRVLRAQLSNAEQLMLYYNYVYFLQIFH